MSEVAIAILCGLFAAIAWGIADFFAAKASRSVGPALSVVIVNAIGLVAFALFFAITQQTWSVTTEGVWYAIAAGLGIGLGQVAFFQALNVGPVSLVSPLSSGYPLFTTIAVLALFQARLSAWQLVGIAVIMLGILMASNLFSLSRKDWRIGRGPFLAITVAVAWGLGYAFLAQALGTISWQVATLIQFTVVASVCALALPLIKGEERVFTRSSLVALKNPFVIGTGIIQMLGMIAINVGLELNTDLAPAVTAVSACYPVLTILLALAHFKEIPKLVPLGGAAVTIMGVVVLSLNG